jgi:hypothetical protein
MKEKDGQEHEKGKIPFSHGYDLVVVIALSAFPVIVVSDHKLLGVSASAATVINRAYKQKLSPKERSPLC